VNGERGFRQIDHTADLALEIWAPAEVDLLVEAARAVVDVLTESADLGAKPPVTVPVSVAGIDREDRLVRWLNEILVLAVHEGFLLLDAAIELEGEEGLSARVRARPGARELVSTELKAVTYHDLRLERDGRGWRARVVIDV
jgi:SHS2 domain-containing protein